MYAGIHFQDKAELLINLRLLVLAHCTKADLKRAL